MAPARTSTRRTQLNQNPSTRAADADTNNDVANEELFLEPMMGTPLAMYIEKDVQDRDVLVDIITVSIRVASQFIGRVFCVKGYHVLRSLYNDTFFESSYALY